MLRVILIFFKFGNKRFRVAVDVYKDMKKLLFAFVLFIVIDVSQCVGFAPGIYCGYENCYDGEL